MGDVVEIGGDCFRCNRCGVLPLANFHSSAVRKNLHSCRACVQSRNANYFKSRPEVFLKAELRKRDKDTCELSSADLLEIYRRFGRRCFVTGEPLGSPTVIRVKANEGLTPSNSVPVSKGLARALGYVLPTELHELWRKRIAEGKGATSATGPSYHRSRCRGRGASTTTTASGCAVAG